MGTCCLSCIPKRYVICFLVFWALGINYILRFSLGLLITVMVRPTYTQQTDERIDDDLYCPLDDDTTTNFSNGTGKKHNGEFSWDEYTQGIILSSFFWGYILAQVPGGMIAERVGGKYTLAWAVFVPSVLSVLSPLIVRRGGPWAFVAVRVVSGLGQVWVYIPIYKRATLKMGTTGGKGETGKYTGAFFGNIVSMFVSGLVLSWTDGDWAAVFYLYGGSGLVWLVVWLWLGYSRPEDHPGLSPSEREYLEQYTASVNMKKKLPPTPWLRMLTSIRLWASSLVLMGSNWGLFSTLTNLPKYMTSVLHFSAPQTGLWSSLLYVSMCVGAGVSAMAVDLFATRNLAPINVTRRIFVTITLLCPALCIFAASYANCNKDLFLIFMVLGMGLLGFDVAGVKLCTLDLSPNYAGSVMAFATVLGALAGILPPYLMGIIITDNTVVEWRYVFMITVVVMICTNLFFIFFSSAEIQPWNDPDSSDDVTDSSSATVEI